MNCNILIPMAGEGSRFKKAGYEKPKPFIDVLGIPMIEHVMKNLSTIKNANFILIARKEHVEKEKETVDMLVQKYNARFICIDQLTEGTACTILHARKYIQNDTPLFIANSDQYVETSINYMLEDCHKRNLDGSILTFEDPEMNPKWSFAKINDQQIVTEVREKVPISNKATVGIYYFRSGNDFINYAVDMIAHNERVNNEFYTAPVYNWGIKDNKKYGIFDIAVQEMFGLGTPEDLEKFISYKTAKTKSLN